MAGIVLSVGVDAGLRCVLRDAGFEVIEAAADSDVQKLAAETLPALVVLAMDVSGAPDVCKRLKADSATSAIPVLHISSGVDAAMQEPVVPPVLLGVAEALICAGQAHASREGETMYRHLFENMTEEAHIWKRDLDAEGRIVSWRLVDANPSALKTWRKTLDEIKGRSPDEIVGPGYVTLLQKNAPEGVPYTTEMYRTKLNKHFRFTCVSRGDYLIGTGVDITAQKRSDQALRNSEQQLRALAGSLLTAQEDERRRLARELHDDITQRLALLAIELGKIVREIPDSLEETRGQLRGLQTRALEASTEVRRISHGLHPSVIEDFGLSIALEEFCEEFGKAQGINARFEGFVEDSQLDSAGATCLYRIAQESMRNAVIHGEATEILVALSAGAGCIQMRVRDNGLGLSIEASRAKNGLGWVSMRERIRLVNGTLSFSSQPGQGAEIIVAVPLAGGGLEAGAHSAG